MFSQYKLFLRWWLFVTIALVGGIFGYKWGIFHEIYNQDVTKISFLIFTILGFMSLWCGIKTFRLSRMPKKIKSDSEYYYFSKKLEDLADIGWFSSDLCLTLGMIGTVVGFIFMLGNGFANLDIGNVQSIQEALVQIGLGMSTALYTTLVGMISSVILKIQYFNLTHGLKGIVAE